MGHCRLAKGSRAETLDDDDDDEDDKDDDYEDDEQDGQVKDDVEDGEDDGYEDDDEDGQVNVHVTAVGDHAQNTGICSIFVLFVQHAAQGCGARHVVTSILVLLLLPALLRYCLRSTMSLSAPPHSPPGTTAKRPKTQKKTEVNTRRLGARSTTTTTTTTIIIAIAITITIPITIAMCVSPACHVSIQQ